jgi:crossover junction endodeoxyribonuclease RusA
VTDPVLELALKALVSGTAADRAYAIEVLTRALKPAAESRVFELPYPVSANNYWRTAVLKNTRPPRAITYLSEEAKAYKSQVALLTKIQGWSPTASRVEIDVAVYRPRKIGDLDNTLKVTLDSIKGAAYLDDKQVTKIVAERFDDANNPRAVVTVTPRE